MFTTVKRLSYFLGIFSKNKLKKLVFLWILEKKIPPKLLKDSKRTPAFFGGIVSPLGRWYKKLGQNSKATPGRPLKNDVLQPLIFGARGDKLGFSLKAAQFFSIGRSDPKQYRPPSRVLIVFWENIPKLAQKTSFFFLFWKQFCQNYSETLNALLFFLMASCHLWEGACKSLDQNFKAAPRRPMKNAKTGVL